MNWPTDLAERLAQGLVVIDRAGVVMAVNSEAGRLLGTDLLVGMVSTTLRNVIPDPTGWPATPVGGEALLAAGGRLLRLRVQTAAEGRLWLIDDISEEFRLRARLAEQAMTIAHASEGFLVIALDGTIRYANETAEGERGVGAGELVGRQLATMERPCSDDYDHVQIQSPADIRQRLSHMIATGRPLRYHAWHLRADGGELPVDVVLRPHRISNEPVGLMTARDDGRRLANLQALTQAKAEAEAANRAKSAFLAITSHELRTPLTGIIGFCELLQLDLSPQEDEAHRYLRLIAESSQSLLGIINDILDLSKIEARTLEVKLGMADAQDILHVTQAIWRERASSKHLALITLPVVGAPVRFTTDIQRVRQMLDNLLSNALKFTERGSVSVGLEYGKDAVEFVVIDTGAGIPEAAQEHLFRAFWQAADHTTRAVGGNGLGLYITRSLAQLLGGRVWLQRSGNSGSEFRLRLPIGIGPRPSGRIMKSDLWLGRQPT